MPGENPGVFRLHMPVKHRHVARRATPPAEVASGTDALPQAAAPVTPPPPVHPAKHVAPTPTPAAPATQTAGLDSLPEDSAARLVGAAGATPGKPAKKAPPSPHATAPPAYMGAAPVPFSFGGSPPPAAPPPRRTASATPPPAVSTPPGAAAGLKRLSIIPFPVGESSPAPADINGVRALAVSLNAALNAGAQRVQLEAYGGPRGDKSSDSRRLSLKRALVIRELLIEDGVPSEKIDVRAMGGADDNGAADRVDIFVRT
jgi:outer membrane protein OmpA-like peptidoglycan-associated protein